MITLQNGREVQMCEIVRTTEGRVIGHVIAKTKLIDLPDLPDVQEYAVWFVEQMADGKFVAHWGHYTTDPQDAFNNYVTRCSQLYSDTVFVARVPA